MVPFSLMHKHFKGLWALFWRMILFVPVGLFGFAALALVLALTVVPPAYAVIAFIGGRFLLGLMSLMIWIVWFRFGGCVRLWVLEGFEHASW